MAPAEKGFRLPHLGDHVRSAECTNNGCGDQTCHGSRQIEYGSLIGIRIEKSIERGNRILLRPKLYWIPRKPTFILMIWLMVSGILILLIFCLDGLKLNYFPNLKDGMYKYLAVIQKNSYKNWFFGTIIGLYWILLNQHGRWPWDTWHNLSDSIEFYGIFFTLLADNFVPAVLTILKKSFSGCLYFSFLF